MSPPGPEMSPRLGLGGRVFALIFTLLFTKSVPLLGEKRNFLTGFTEERPFPADGIRSEMFCRVAADRFQLS